MNLKSYRSINIYIYIWVVTKEKTTETVVHITHEIIKI